VSTVEKIILLLEHVIFEMSYFLKHPFRMRYNFEETWEKFGVEVGQ
jgi:hypothetical protein